MRSRPLGRIPQSYVGKKVDAHTHIGDFGGWANVACSPKELLASMKLYEVERSIVFYFDNDLVHRAVSSYPDKLTGCVWPDPRKKGARLLVRKALAQWGFKGVKLHPLLHAFLPNDEIVYPIMEEARRARVPVLIHSGHPPFSLPWSIGELAENFKDVTIVMLHMGHGHGVYIQAAINVARRLDNILLETSGMPMHSKVREAVKLLGEDRVLYGSDIPFHDPSVEIGRVSASGLSNRELERVFYSNAKRVFRL
ncbi:MAG TPA: amidohydrolase family protein [Nitrososphaerales archaeon]|nr:amidohydrolase family protein [Nitrososphaerales archaeon]